MRVDFELTPQTMLAANYKYLAQGRLAKLVRWLGFVAGPIIGIVILAHHPVARTSIVIRANGKTIPLLVLLVYTWIWMAAYLFYIGGGIFLGYLWWRYAAPTFGEMLVKALLPPETTPRFWGHRSFEVAEQGFTYSDPAGSRFVRWWAVKDALELDQFVFVITRFSGNFLIPKNAVSNASDAEIFLKVVSRHIWQSSAVPCLPNEAQCTANESTASSAP